MTQAKNAICLWYDKDAEEAANFYAETFPDSEVTGVHKAPGDFPGGKGGDVSSFSVPHSGNVTLAVGFNPR